MRNLSWMLKGLLGGTALLAAVGGCESRTVAVSVPQPELQKVAVATPSEVVLPTLAVEVKSDELVPEKLDQLLDAARGAIKAGELDRALKLARIATSKSPKRSAAWNTLGRVQLQRGYRKAAIEAFDKAVALNPDSSYAQNNLGLALIYEGRFDEAAAVLKSAVESDHVEAYMWNNLGMAYEHLDRLAEARDAYQQAADLSSDRAVESLARLQGVKTLRVARADDSVLDQ